MIFFSLKALLFRLFLFSPLATINGNKSVFVKEDTLRPSYDIVYAVALVKEKSMEVSPITPVYKYVNDSTVFYINKDIEKPFVVYFQKKVIAYPVDPREVIIPAEYATKAMRIDYTNKDYVLADKTLVFKEKGSYKITIYDENFVFKKQINILNESSFLLSNCWRDEEQSHLYYLQVAKLF